MNPCVLTHLQTQYCQDWLQWPPPQPKKPGPLLSASSHVGAAPSAAPSLCHLCLCTGVGWAPALLPACPPQQEQEVGRGSRLWKRFPPSEARGSALLHWGQQQLPKYFKDFAEKTSLQVRRTVLEGEDPLNTVWECPVGRHWAGATRDRPSDLASCAAGCHTLAGRLWAKPAAAGNGLLSVSLSSIKGSDHYPWIDCQMENICFI